MNTPAIALAAGGTGGHIFPAEALAQALLARGCKVMLMTDQRGQGFGALPEVEVVRLSGSAVLGRSALQKVSALLSLLRGTWQARRPLKRSRAKAVVGFGGFASVPPAFAARTLGLPVILHEQNAVLGRANRLLAGRATSLATAFPEVGAIAAPDRQKLRQVGNPVRPAIAALRERPYPPLDTKGRISLLVTGGSQGAKAFDSLIPAALSLLPEALRHRLDLVQQVRGADRDALAARYRELGVSSSLAPFFEDLPRHLGDAHLLIGRSGASTVFELAMAGRPGLLIPYPHAADDHQNANAIAFATAGGGWVLPEAGADAEVLSNQLERLLTTPDLLQAAAEKARGYARPDAAERLADLTLEVIAAEGGSA